MAYCARCGDEYEEWATVCADCGAPLTPGPKPAVPAPPRRDPGKADPWVYATNVPNAILGNLLVNQLQDAGIPARMLRSASADVGEWSHNDFVPQDVLVPAPLLADARRLITSPPGPLTSGPSGPFPDWEPLQVGEGDTQPLGPAPEPADGWHGLLTESDYMAVRALRKTHGDDPAWSEEESPLATRRTGRGRGSSGGNWTDNRWFRIAAGVFFLLAALPWLFQILQQIVQQIVNVYQR